MNEQARRNERTSPRIDEKARQTGKRRRVSTCVRCDKRGPRLQASTFKRAMPMPQSAMANHSMANAASGGIPFHSPGAVRSDSEIRSSTYLCAENMSCFLAKLGRAGLEAPWPRRP